MLSFLEKFSPNWLVLWFRYGKSNNRSHLTSNTLIQVLQVPKSGFGHFYIYSSILQSALLYLVLHVYLFGIELPNWMIHFLDFVATDSRSRAKVTPESIVIALTLMALQSMRRMYECYYVNAPSKAQISLFHYLVGYIHYTCVGFGIISHAPGLQKPHNILFEGQHQSIKWVHIQLQLTNVSVVDWLAIGFFLWAWKHQFVAHKILARTKKQSLSGYGLPHGDWFNYLSCPHYTAECLLYLSVQVIFGLEHTTWILVCIWVLSNQLIVSIMSHQWYVENFPNYTRKALIPYIL